MHLYLLKLTLHYTLNILSRLTVTAPGSPLLLRVVATKGIIPSSVAGVLEELIMRAQHLLSTLSLTYASREVSSRFCKKYKAFY